MSIASLLENYGEPWVLAIGGSLIGILFGFCAQRSQFCLRAAIIESKSGKIGEKTTVWLVAFATAILMVQIAIGMGWFDPKDARQLASVNSLSGALIGGFVFGIGMIMTRACAGRMVVLAAGGNLRALLSGLVFAVTAQATIGGVLAPLRAALSGWWQIDGHNNHLGQLLHLPAVTGVMAGALLLGVGIFLAKKKTGLLGFRHFYGFGVGAAIALGWWFSYAVSTQSFEPIATQGLTFSLPSAEWLTRVTTNPGLRIGFDFGLLPGVVLGAFLAAYIGKTLKFEGFSDAPTMIRYMLGAVLMGFGAILGGGCSIGAAVTGSSILAVTAFVTLASIVVGALLANRLIGAH